MKKHFLMTAFVGLLAAATFCACSKDGDGEVNIEEGKFAGTTWVRKESINNSVSRREYTYTVNFTSATEVTYKESGWWQIYQNGSKKWSEKTTENKTNEYTYLYAPEINTGTYTKKGSTAVSGTFSFVDESTLKFGGSTYERQ
jgi:hypothetical protein